MTVSFAAVKDQFLSTEPPIASLTIFNPTSQTVSYTSLSLFYEIRDSYGTVHREPVRLHFSMVSTQIKAHERRTSSLPLPSCEVLSDPCSERVALGIYLEIGGKQKLFLTAERTYNLVPDPSATFQISGLRDNRPLLIARGEASGAISQRDLEIAFQFFVPPNKYATDAPQVASVTDAFARHGLHADHRFLNDRDGFQVRMLLRNHGTGPNVEAAISDIAREFGPGVKLVSMEFAPDSSDIAKLIPPAAAAAASDAQRTLGFFSDGEVAPAYGPDFGDFVEVQTTREGQDPKTRPFLPFVLTDWSRSEERSAEREAIAVRVRDMQGFTARTPLSGVTFGDLHVTQYAGRDLSDLAVLPIRAPIGADRPEIYAVALTTTRDADRLGYQPRAVAVSLALRRVRTLAAGLGVAPQWISLVAEYPPIESSSHTTIHGAGVAMTPAENLDAAWQRLLATPSPLPLVGIPVLPATPAPFRFDLAPFAVPIELPHWQTRLIVRADRPVTVTPDRLRLNVAIDSPQPFDVRAPDPDAVQRTLRNNPLVYDVAVQTSGEGFPFGYQILMKAGDRKSLDSVVNQLRGAYRATRVTLRFSVRPAVGDCETPLAQAQQASLESALHMAIERAQTAGTTLRHLVIAAALPISVDDDGTCDVRARPEALDVANDPDRIAPIGNAKRRRAGRIDVQDRRGAFDTRDALAAASRPRLGRAHVLGDERQR